MEVFCGLKIFVSKRQRTLTFFGGDCMNEGDVLICIDQKDEHYLQIGYVNLIDIEGFETNVAYVEYQDKSTVKYEVWRMEGCFRRFITEGLRI